jgi:hypothetical protein
MASVLDFQRMAEALRAWEKAERMASMLGAGPDATHEGGEAGRRTADLRHSELTLRARACGWTFEHDCTAVDFARRWVERLSVTELRNYVADPRRPAR